MLSAPTFSRAVLKSLLAKNNYTTEDFDFEIAPELSRAIMKSFNCTMRADHDALQKMFDMLNATHNQLQLAFELHSHPNPVSPDITDLADKVRSVTGKHTELRLEFDAHSHPNLVSPDITDLVDKVRTVTNKFETLKGAYDSHSHDIEVVPDEMRVTNYGEVCHHHICLDRHPIRSESGRLLTGFKLFNMANLDKRLDGNMRYDYWTARVVAGAPSAMEKSKSSTREPSGEEGYCSSEQSCRSNGDQTNDDYFASQFHYIFEWKKRYLLKQIEAAEGDLTELRKLADTFLKSDQANSAKECAGDPSLSPLKEAERICATIERVKALQLRLKHLEEDYLHADLTPAELHRKIAIVSSQLSTLQNDVAIQALPVGTILAFHGDKNLLPDMARAGWVVCDGSTPESQNVVNARREGPTPNLTDGRYLKGQGPNGIGVVGTANTLVIGTSPGNQYTHSPLVVPTDGTFTRDSNGNFPFGGKWEQLGTQVQFNWQRADPEPKHLTVLYVMKVK